jgi:aspartate/methionine/tyrosine aminotransferase
MRRSRLPVEKPNLFQAIRAKRAQVQEKGLKLIDLSIGEPRGPALLSARKAAATAVMSDQEDIHKYQYNGSPGIPGFAKKFVEFSLRQRVEQKDVTFLPIAGIKRMLGIMPAACGSWDRPVTVGAMTEPGYPFPADWCKYLKVDHYPLPLNPQNGFLFEAEGIRAGTNLIMANYPHNPTGCVANREFWRQLCGYCSDHDIRLFNDAAYIVLSHTEKSAALTEVAVEFPELSWAEAFSASKVIGNGTGWQIGAMAGSPDFMDDIANVKGNTDEGFVAAMAIGVQTACEHDWNGVDGYRQLYRNRLQLLIKLLTNRGMRLAVHPDAGFFSLWMVPNRAFDQKIESVEHFNFLMMERTGVIGVHFEPSYMRYAVCEDIESKAKELDDAFARADVSYS